MDLDFIKGEFYIINPFDGDDNEINIDNNNKETLGDEFIDFSNLPMEIKKKYKRIRG